MSAGLSEIGLALAAGSLTTLSPCVFPLLPLVIGGGVQSNRLAPLAMGAGMVGSFTIGGILIGVIGEAVSLDVDVVRISSALLLLTFGIVMLVPALDGRFSRMMTPIANSANRTVESVDGGSLYGALALGAMLGLVWSPCSGPLLATALALVASEGGALRGGTILGMFGLGAATPLVGVAYASRAGFASFRDQLLSKIRAIKRGFGLMIAAVGILILTGGDKWIESQITALLPDSWLLMITRY